MFSIKALAVATAVSAGVVLAMPVASQAMPQSAPVKVDTATNNVRHTTRKWAHYCRYHMGDSRCNHGRVYGRYYRHRYYDEPYYGYDEPYYGSYRPRYSSPGLHLPFGVGIY